MLFVSTNAAKNVAPLYRRLHTTHTPEADTGGASPKKPIDLMNSGEVSRLEMVEPHAALGSNRQDN